MRFGLKLLAGTSFVFSPLIFSKFQEGKDYSLDANWLVERLKRYQNKDFVQGIYPHRENPADTESALERIDEIRKILEIDRIVVGIFVSFNQLMDRNFCEQILIPWMLEVDKKGGINNLSVTSYRRNWYGHPFSKENLPYWEEGLYQVEENSKPFLKIFELRPWFEANTNFPSEAFSYNLYGISKRQD